MQRRSRRDRFRGRSGGIVPRFNVLVLLAILLPSAALAGNDGGPFTTGVKVAPGVVASGARVRLTDPSLTIVQLAPSRAGVRGRHGGVFLEIVCFCPRGGACRAVIEEPGGPMSCEPADENPCSAECKMDIHRLPVRRPWPRLGPK